MAVVFGKVDAEGLNGAAIRAGARFGAVMCQL